MCPSLFRGAHASPSRKPVPLHCAPQVAGGVARAAGAAASVRPPRLPGSSRRGRAGPGFCGGVERRVKGSAARSPGGARLPST
jgi:hypothetical protein